ncbi:methylamine utilization protein [Duganella sp. FT50W]|uniref:Methylamine utilization protein n=1 Tax=Duganella lactea TaxID=2692173 RepID=A0A6L8MK10_9BURK|nr:methylamine utilization protein [Duganella lactea]MYM83517.1 methylamine utilization protein [Duganella lactea]
MSGCIRVLFLLSVVSAPVMAATGIAVQIQDATGKVLPDTVVYVESDAIAQQAGRPGTASIEQKGLKFLPLVTVVQTGATINFPNNDKVRHHIYSFSPAHKFDQKLYSGQAASPQVFDKAGTVVLGCNIHDNMIAYIKVVDTPHFAKTDGAGAARIELPAAGKYVVKAWHYNAVGGATAEQTLTVKAGELATAVLKLSLKPAVVGDTPP